MYSPTLKRSFDLLVTIPALLLLAPVLALVALLVRLKLGAPVLFCQQRPGLHGKPFTLYKFRTMTDARDAQGHLLPDAERLTNFGRFLRSSSLDELPELWNVIKGDMSLVGPRPLLLEYLPYYAERERARHNVRPGLTGLAQVSGRNTLSWDERLELDVQYVEQMSFVADVVILWKTCWKVIEREGVVIVPGEQLIPLNEYRKEEKSGRYDDSDYCIR
ncbi:MAG TPA: sugar transferase [Chloroflexi bacterium]|nr:sugar transferase [Chloroflexota bacterium]